MYAVIETGGKQYRVTPGDILDVELQPAGSQEDGQIVFDRVLLLGGDEPQVGKPTIAGATVRAELLGEVRGPKLTIFKMKKRTGYRRKNGHRQNYLRVRIQDITSGGASRDNEE